MEPYISSTIRFHSVVLNSGTENFARKKTKLLQILDLNKIRDMWRQLAKSAVRKNSVQNNSPDPPA
jgi:hypothetical protein